MSKRELRARRSRHRLAAPATAAALAASLAIGCPLVSAGPAAADGCPGHSGTNGFYYLQFGGYKESTGTNWTSINGYIGNATATIHNSATDHYMAWIQEDNPAGTWLQIGHYIGKVFGLPTRTSLGVFAEYSSPDPLVGEQAIDLTSQGTGPHNDHFWIWPTGTNGETGHPNYTAWYGNNQSVLAVEQYNASEIIANSEGLTATNGGTLPTLTPPGAIQYFGQAGSGGGGSSFALYKANSLAPPIQWAQWTEQPTRICSASPYIVDSVTPFSAFNVHG